MIRVLNLGSGRARMMHTMLPLKQLNKQERERKVLLGLVEYYIRTGKPVGSHSLQEAGFEELSSATIRNYFSTLEKEGFLTQTHLSGGRVPTPAAYQLYVHCLLEEPSSLAADPTPLQPLAEFEGRTIASLLQQGADLLSGITRCAVFLSAPRFDQDMVIDIKLVPIDVTRCLCVIITAFGVINTEVIQVPHRLSQLSIKRIEHYFQERLAGQPVSGPLDPEEESLGKKIYNELIVRYIISYSHFTDMDLYRTGFAQLLHYPEFQEISELAKGLALFEDLQGMRRLLRECQAHNALRSWIETSLPISHAPSLQGCSVLAIPYYVHQSPVGAVGLLGPNRMPYRDLIAQLRSFSDEISRALTRNIYKFKIQYREPGHNPLKPFALPLLGEGDARLVEHDTTPQSG